MQREARRTVEAQVRVQELSERVEELEIAQAERADELASWDGEVPTDARTLAVPDLDAVADLLAWEERVTSATSGSQQPPQPPGLSGLRRTPPPRWPAPVVVRDTGGR